MNSNLTELKRNLPDFLPKAKRTGYICPVCGNGSGNNGDGIVLDRSDASQTHYKCFKCGFYGDIIDLIGLHYGITDDKEKFNKARELYGSGNTFTQNYTFKPQNAEDPQEDYTSFFLKAAAQNDYKYLLGRGISEETQKHFNIGYDPVWKSPKAIKTVIAKGGNPDKLPTSPRVIIPRSKYNYLARDTREEVPEDQKAYIKQDTGKTSIFNIEALEGSEPVFIVEGEIDAMSVYEAGGQAIGLCSVSNRRLLLNYLKDHSKAGQVFIIMLDQDEAGKTGQAELEKDLKEIEIPYILAEYVEHDPNDYLQHDRSGFESLISSLKAEAIEAGKEAKGNEYNAADLLNYFRSIEEQPAGFEAKTGFEDLDYNLNGGLHEGLYIIGAISSLGKTTFTLQLADQIAGSGQDVIFFSLEMSKYELMAKSISRHTFTISRNSRMKDGRLIARDTQQILNNRRYKAYTDQEKEVITKAIAEYEKKAQNLYIYEGRYKGERLTVAAMRTIIENHVKSTGKKPVVFVDYLQIIAPADPRSTDKQNTDTAVFELKEISRDLSIPVFVISSFNRENYLEPVSMTSFKESGAVEYSSDILFGLQYAGMEYQGGESEKNRKERLRELQTEIYRKKREFEPIEIELKCLKQRTGYQFTLSFYMVPAFNHFEALLGRTAFQESMKKAGKVI